MPTTKNFGKSEVFVEPTKYPWILRKHLSDFTLLDNESIDILKLYPQGIYLFKNIASNTYRQFTLGEDNSSCELTIEWKTGFPIELRLFDRLERPIVFYKGSYGQEKINVFGSVYKIQLTYNGIISKDSVIILRSRKLKEEPANILGVKDAFEEIPRIKIIFSKNSKQSLDNLRKDSERRLIAMGATGNPIETINKKVYARLYYSPTEKSDIRIWQSGQGQITHFNERSPSFSGKIVSGPLLYGICNFKLYTIKSQQGLLDYALGHLAENEGLFVPRRILADVTINNRHAGLYVIEEALSPEFFAAKKQYDGFVQSMGIDYFKPATDGESFDSLNIDTMLKSVDPEKFSQTLALFSRFQAVHGLGSLNMRFYLQPILRTYEPIIRDVNVGIWDGVKSCGVRELLTYTNFWMGERPFALGSHYNIKTPDFKSSSPLAPQAEAYTWTTTTLGLSNLHPLVQYFVNIPRFREMFESRLFYYAGPTTEQSFLNVLANTFNVAGDFLLDEDDYYKTIFYQAKKQYKDEPMTMSQFIYPLLKKSRILVIPSSSGENDTLYTLFNLSTFSMRLKKDVFPGYCEIIDKDIDIKDNGYFMAPSKFFAMCINNLYNLNDEFTLDKLTQKSIKKILNIEFRSYLKKYLSGDIYVGPKPFLRIKVTQDKAEEFEKIIARGDMFKTADNSFLDGNQIKFLKDFDLENPRKIIVNKNKNAGLSLSPINLEEDLLIQNIGQYPIAGGYMVRYIFLNQSSKNIDIDLRKANDPRIKEVKASLIGIDGVKELPSYFTLAPMERKNFEKTTNLWIDNFIPLFNGTENEKELNVAIVDLYFNITNLNRERDLFSIFMEDKISSFSPGYLYNSIACKNVTPPRAVFKDSFEEWDFSQNGSSLPKGLAYFQEGSKGAVRKCAIKENIKEGKASIRLKPSSRGASYLRCQLSDIEELKGRSVKFSVWVKSSNKFLNAIQVDVQDGIEAPMIVSYSNSGGWELLELNKYVPKNAKFILITYNIKHEANTFVYFDNATMVYSDDQFKVKIYEPYNVPALPHDLLGEEKIKRTIVKIDDNRKKQKEIIYFKENSCNTIFTVEENQILVLKPGQVIHFSENAGIIVHGQILAKGSKDKKIELLPVKDKWLGLMVVNNNETDKINYLTNCKIIGASGVKANLYNPSGGLSFIKTNVILKDIELDGFFSEDSLHFYKSNFKVTGLHLSGGPGDGIDSDWSYGKITKSYFEKCGGDCVDFSGSLGEISNSSICKASDKGISVGESSVVLVNNNKIDENTIGIAVKDQSIVRGKGNNLRANTTAGIALYIKKPNFIKPAISLEESEFQGNGKNVIKCDFRKIIREYDK